MKISGITKKLIACFLIIAMMACGPFANVPRDAFAAGEDTASGTAAEEAPEVDASDDSSKDDDEAKDDADAKETEAPKESDESKLYISEVKIGMGKNEDEAAKALTSNGFFIVQKDGKPVDLNKGSTTKRPRVIFLGYKTTTDPNEGITDLAVMNMNGGYSFSDYDELLKKAMETQVKPFVESFLATINEYRENHDKPKNTVNYKRAEMVRKILNKYTDDDTDGGHIGDLLLNETKYEMGDKAYEALPEVDKKDTLDIVTMIMQGNLTSINIIERFLVKAADSSDSTWVERFEKTGYDQLFEEFEKKYPDDDKSDILKKMDKKYNDTAKKILDVWDDFAETAENYEDKKDEIENSIDEDTEKIEDSLGRDPEKMSVDELADAIIEADKAQVETIELTEDIVAVNAGAELDKKENEDGNLREFFAQPADTFKGDGIRKLYPVVASLSEGQIAGIQFLTLQELIDAGLNSIENLDQEMIKDVETVSVYEGVNREVFEHGVVAMTNDALRQQALIKDNDINAFTKTRNTGIGLLAAGATIGIVAGVVAKKLRLSRRLWLLKDIADELKGYTNGIKLKDAMKTVKSWDTKVNEDIMFYTKEQATQALAQGNRFSRLIKAAIVVVSVAMVALIVTGIILTIKGIREDNKATDYSPIPKYIVDETDITRFNEKGEKEFYRNDTAYYQVVECNRKDLLKEGSALSKDDGDFLKKRVDEVGDRGDLNGDDGRQWLALYTVKYGQSTPILADSLTVMTGAASSTPPDGYTTGIHMFGEKSAYNLKNPKLIREEEAEAVRIYFKQDKEAFKTSLSVSGGNETDTKDGKIEETGSLTTDRSTLLYLVIGFAAGVVVVWIIMFIFGRRKKDETVE